MNEARACDLQVLESGNLQVQMDEIDLEEQIGRGGFGAVYKGSWRGAQVAVKYIACDVADAEAVDQSVREVVLSKKMSHPNVVQTYGFTMTGSSDLGVDQQVASGRADPVCCFPCNPSGRAFKRSVMICTVMHGEHSGP